MGNIIFTRCSDDCVCCKRAEGLAVDLSNLQADLLAKNRQLGGLKKKLEEGEEQTPESAKVRAVLNYYVETLGKTKKFKTPNGGARWKAVQKMLLVYSVEELKCAVDGAARRPFVGPKGRTGASGPGCKRHDDPVLIFRDEATVSRFMSYADDPAPIVKNVAVNGARAIRPFRTRRLMGALSLISLRMRVLDEEVMDLSADPPWDVVPWCQSLGRLLDQLDAIQEAIVNARVVCNDLFDSAHRDYETAQRAAQVLMERAVVEVES